MACQNCSRSWVYLDSGIRKCKYCGYNFNPPNGWLPKRGQGKGKDREHQDSSGTAANAKTETNTNGQNQGDLFKYCQHRYGSMGAAQHQQPADEADEEKEKEKPKLDNDEKLKGQIEALEQYIAMADSVTDELVPGHTQSIIESKQKLVQLKGQAAANLPHHDQVQRANVRVQRANDKVEKIRKQLEENNQYVDQMEKLLGTMQEDRKHLQQRLEEAEKQHKAEQDLQSQTWATTAKGHLGDLQAFKILLNNLAAKADPNSEMAELMATGKQLAASLETAGATGDEPMEAEPAPPEEDDSLAIKQLEALEALIPEDKRAEWNTQKEKMAAEQPKPPPTRASAASAALAPPKHTGLPRGRDGPGRGKGARGDPDAEEKAEKRRVSKSPRRVQPPTDEEDQAAEPGEAAASAAKARSRP